MTELEKYSISSLKRLLEDYLGIPTDDFKTKEEYIENYLYAQELSRETNWVDLPPVKIKAVVSKNGMYLGSKTVKGIKDFPD